MLHKEGLFASFGLSNYSPADVEAIHTLCVQSGWVPPTTYPGNLSAFARHSQKTLFPTLRRLGTSFSAYSPPAGGFLARASAAELAAPETGGRSAVDLADPEGGKGGLGLYRQMYSERPALVAALRRWAEIARGGGLQLSCRAGVSLSLLAYGVGGREGIELRSGQVGPSSRRGRRSGWTRGVRGEGV